MLMPFVFQHEMNVMNVWFSGIFWVKPVLIFTIKPLKYIQSQSIKVNEIYLQSCDIEWSNLARTFIQIKFLEFLWNILEKIKQISVFNWMCIWFPLFCASNYCTKIIKDRIICIDNNNAREITATHVTTSEISAIILVRAVNGTAICLVSYKIFTTIWNAIAMRARFMY